MSALGDTMAMAATCYDPREEALARFKANSGWSGLPWEPSDADITAIFNAGWEAANMRTTPSPFRDERYGRPFDMETLKGARDLFIDGRMDMAKRAFMDAMQDHRERERDERERMMSSKMEHIGRVFLSEASPPDDFSVTPMPATITAREITPDDIYQAYPRKVAKAGAIKAIKKAIKLHGAEAILRKVTAYGAAVKAWTPKDRYPIDREGRKFDAVPHPATWFNRGSYDDDPKEWARGGSATTSQFSKPSH